MKGVTGIYYTYWDSYSPARANRRTGEIYINRKVWKHLPKAHRFFVLLHEAGHIVRQTRNEVKADEYAFKIYADMGYSLSNSVLALSRVLSFDNPEHYWRTYRQLQRAKAYDYFNNGNKKAFSGLT